MKAPIRSQELDVLRFILREVVELDERVSRLVYQWGFCLIGPDYAADFLQ